MNALDNFLLSKDEMVVLVEGHLDLKRLTKDGWTTLIFIGYATVAHKTFLRRLANVFGLFERYVPMYKLMKGDAHP